MVHTFTVKQIVYIQQQKKKALTYLFWYLQKYKLSSIFALNLRFIYLDENTIMSIKND